MAFTMLPRTYMFMFYSTSFYVVLCGILTPGLAFPISALVILILYFKRFKQLPQTRLKKFAAMFGFEADGGTDTTSVTHSRIILHRGGCDDAPENTLEAIREAAKQGVAGVEIDLQFTADGVGILLHDDTLDRTTNGSGDVREMSFSDLKDLDAAANHKNKDKYPGQVKIPTLEECLTECLRLNLLVFIDCKAYAQKTANLVDELFQKYPELYDVGVVCSFFPNIVYAMRKKNPQVITALTHRKMSMSTEGDCVTPLYSGFKHYKLTILDYLNNWLVYAWTWHLCGNSFILLNKEGLSRHEVNRWKSLGIYILPWTINSVIEKQLCMDHLQIPIITDGLHTD